MQTVTETNALPPHLRLATDPVANPDNVVSGERWRISVIEAGLFRLEWSPSGSFEDRPSQTVLNRGGEQVPMKVRESDDTIEIVTARAHLTYDRKPFSTQGLSVQAVGGISNYHSVWRYGVPAEGNLGGTARTLDGVDGRAPLEPGVLSRYGIATHDDSGSVMLTDDGWVAPREPGSLDVYVFSYGRDYRAALSALYRLTGPQPIVPRFALGNWWSRYHAYSADEYVELMDRFAERNVPLSVAVLDMDWHRVDVAPRYGSGWTGYSWNRDLFPDPEAFLLELHSRGLRVTVNVHPADGIQGHEDCYPTVARAMGQDPDDDLPVAFDPTDPKFLRTYLEDVHHPLEAQGVDFFWLDWQSGRISRMPGLDPLWLLNHLHFLDSGRPGGPLGARPMTFSRYAGLGSHRYPVGFSGDTVITWDSLAFQPEFTATASNVGYGWWSHDVGGHMHGVKDDELATRWVQLGVVSPILRLHSTSHPFNSKEPWTFGDEANRVMSRYLRFRHQLLPYLSTMARRANVECRPLVEPMYHLYPMQEAAYSVPNQFLFGTSLLAAPVTEPRDPATLRAKTAVWLPDGDWVDVLTGLAYRGGRRIACFRDIDTMPLFARAGAVFPMIPESTVSNETGPPDSIDLWVVAGADGAFTITEDDDDDRWAFTEVTYSATSGEVRVDGAHGDLSTLPERREMSLLLLGFTDIDDVTVRGRSVALEPGPVRGSMRALLGAVETDTGITASIHGDRSLGPNDVADRAFDLLDEAQIEFAMKASLWAAVRDLPPPEAALTLEGLDAPPTVAGALTEILLARP